MELTFKDRSNGWRGRGRPPRRPPDMLLDTLRRTARQSSVAIIPRSGDETPAEVKELRADLRAAQRVLGGRVHYQATKTELRFYWSPEGQP